MLTQEQVDEILADEDRDIHDVASGREAVALAAVHRAAEELAAEFQERIFAGAQTRWTLDSERRVVS